MVIKHVDKGMGIYLSDFHISNANVRMLLNILMYAKGIQLKQNYLTDNVETECAYFPASKQLIVINNSELEQTTTINTEQGKISVQLQPYETKFIPAC
jgi:beta-D-galactosyl-(1->4)-L-rhamnose phosphorylase